MILYSNCAAHADNHLHFEETLEAAILDYESFKLVKESKRKTKGQTQPTENPTPSDQLSKTRRSQGLSTNTSSLLATNSTYV